MPRSPTPSTRPPSELWFIDGRAYDLEDFIADHPGGGAALRMAQGTNCTELVQTYHLMRGPSPAKMRRYEVSVDKTDPRIVELLGASMFTFDDEGFYKTVAARVRKYFLDSGKKVGASRTTQVIAVAGWVLTVILTFWACIWGNLWAAVALGFVRALVSIGPGHAMGHFSLFPRGIWNSLAFRIGSPFMVSTWPIWTNTHTRSHHIDTLTGEDLQDNYPLKRIQASMRHRQWHRGQHFYIWPIYLVALPLWALQDFVASLISLVTEKYMAYRYTMRQRLENVLSIAVNLTLVVALPFFFLDWQTALLVCFISNAICSPIVVVQIVVNHEVPDTMDANPGQDGDWGAHQVLTSHNYGVDSLLALHLSGGLNMQLEHHLFPRVHYTHYPAIAKIVQAACVEFGLPYYASADIWQAVGKHYRVLQLRSVP